MKSVLTHDHIVVDHSPEHLEHLFDAEYLASVTSASILIKPTIIPWLIFVPVAPLSNTVASTLLTQQIFSLAAQLQFRGYGHYNMAKIGNKNPWLHLHLVFRNDSDEAWPDPIWCHEPLQVDKTVSSLFGQDVRESLSSLV